MIPLTHVLRKAKAKYNLGGEKINHLLFMDDFKLYRKNEIKGLVSTVEVFSQDISTEFGIITCSVIIMNRRKVKSTEGIELPSDEKIPEKKMDINTSILEYYTTNER